jgi:hypothetical protein
MSVDEMIIVALNLPDLDHLEYVIGEMKRLGAPKLKAIWSSEYKVWFAAEGSHRLVAAQREGLTPVIIDVTGKDGVVVQREEEDREMTAVELENWLVSDAEYAPWYYFDA